MSWVFREQKGLARLIDHRAGRVRVVEYRRGMDWSATFSKMYRSRI